MWWGVCALAIGLSAHLLAQGVQGHVDELLRLVRKGQHLVDVPDGGKNTPRLNIRSLSTIKRG